MAAPVERTFRLKMGRHAQMEPTDKGPGKNPMSVIDRVTNQVRGYIKTYAALVPRRRLNKETGAHEIIYVCQEGFDEADQYVKSEIDLVRRFGGEKFELVNQSMMEYLGEQYREQSKQEADLSAMSVQQLKAYAEENNIDLGDNQRKDQIIAAIKSAMVPA